MLAPESACQCGSGSAGVHPDACESGQEQLAAVLCEPINNMHGSCTDQLVKADFAAFMAALLPTG